MGLPPQRGGIPVRGTEQRVASFGRLAREQLPRLYAIAGRLVGDDAEDAVQDCLVKGFERFHQLDDPAAASAWLTRVLVNCCHDRGRHRSRRPVEVEFTDVEEFSLYREIAFEDPFPYSDSLHLDFLCRFGTEDVWAVLADMPPLYRFPLVLVHMEGMATQEVADLLDVPLGTLLSRLHRARKRFERALWDYATANDLLREAP